MLISQPVRVGGTVRCAISPTCAIRVLTCTIAIEDGNGLPWFSVKGLGNQAGHAREGNSIDGDDVVFSLHAGAARLGQWLHQKMGVVGVLKRRPSAMRVEEAVEDCSRARYIK